MVMLNLFTNELIRNLLMLYCYVDMLANELYRDENRDQKSLVLLLLCEISSDVNG